MEFLENIGGSFLPYLNKVIGQEARPHLSEIQAKIKYVEANLDRITHVNNVPVFHPVVEGIYLYYFTEASPKEIKNRPKYYCIQYALIQLSDGR